MLRFSLFLLVFFLSIFSFSQVTNLSTVKIDPVARNIDPQPPFDRKFRVEPFDTDNTKILFSYYLEDLESINDQLLFHQGEVISIKQVILQNCNQIDKSVLDGYFQQKNSLLGNFSCYSAFDSDPTSRLEEIKGIFDGTFKIKDPLLRKPFIKEASELDLNSIQCLNSIFKILDQSNPNISLISVNLDKLQSSLEKIELLQDAKEKLKVNKNIFFQGDSFELNVSNNKAYFPKSLGPLKPDYPYAFKFQGFKPLNLDSEEITEFKALTFGLVTKYFNSTRSLDQNDIDSFKSDLQKLLIRTAKTDKIYSLDFKRNIIEELNRPLYEQELGEIAGDYNDFQKGIANANHSILKASQTIISYLSVPTVMDNIIPKFNKLPKYRYKTDAFKEAMNEPLKSSYSSLENDIKFHEFLTATDGKLVYYIEQIVNGSQRLAGKKFEASSELDYQTVVALHSFLNILIDESKMTIQTKKGNKTSYYFMAEKSGIFNILSGVEALQDALESIVENEAGKEELKSKTPNLLADKVVENNIVFQNTLQLDIMAKDNPYFGLDLGFAYNFGINEISTFQTLNFYLVPVDKKADFKYFIGWEKFKKKFSLNVGLAQILTHNDEQTESLLGGNNNLVVGFGYKVSRVLRLNLLEMIYYKKDSNPLLDKKKVSFSPSFGVSIDIDLKEAVGAVGQLFK